MTRTFKQRQRGWLIIKSRNSFLLFLMMSFVVVVAFLFVDNRITGSAVYTPSEVLGFVKGFVQAKLLERQSDIRDAVAETFSEALKSAIDRSVEQAVGANIQPTASKPQITKVYRNDPKQSRDSGDSRDIVYVERDDNTKMECRVVCEDTS